MRLKLKTLAIVFSLLLPILAAFAPAPDAAPAKALCIVCAVTGGESEPEPVRATRTHAGKEYGFCSEKCAKAFEADPAAYLPPDLPRPAPRFSLKTLAGKPISSKTLAGQVVLVDFWATWCAPCRKSMPELEALQRKHAGKGFTVVGISIDEGPSAAVKKFVASKKFSYPIAIDSEKEPAWEAFGVKAVPAAYLIDREGRLVAQWTGSPANTKDLEDRLTKLLAVE